VERHRSVCGVGCRCVTFKAWLSDRVERAPAMTLIVFLVPVSRCVPLKLVADVAVANEYGSSANLMIIFAKFVGVGVTALIFDVNAADEAESLWRWRG